MTKDDAITTLVIFVVIIALALFAWIKGKRGKGFGEWLWVTIFAGFGIFIAWLIFTFFIHFDDPILKLLVMSIAMSILAGIFGIIGKTVYGRKGGT